MLYALIVDSTIMAVVDSPTEIDRMPAPLVKRMCSELKVPWRGIDKRLVAVVPIRPDDIVRWDV